MRIFKWSRSALRDTRRNIPAALLKTPEKRISECSFRRLDGALVLIISVLQYAQERARDSRYYDRSVQIFKLLATANVIVSQLSELCYAQSDSTINHATLEVAVYLWLRGFNYPL